MGNPFYTLLLGIAAAILAVSGSISQANNLLLSPTGEAPTNYPLLPAIGQAPAPPPSYARQVTYVEPVPVVEKSSAVPVNVPQSIPVTQTDSELIGTPQAIPVLTPEAAPPNRPRATSFSQFTPPKGERSTSIAALQSLALMNNPTYNQVANQINIAQGNRLQSQLLPNPALNYELEGLDSSDQNNIHKLKITQEIITAGKRWKEKNVYNAELGALQHKLNAQMYRIHNDVKAYAYRVLAVQKRRELLLELQQINKKVIELSRRRFNAGEASQVEILQANLELEKVNLGLRTVEQEHAIAWRSLSAVVGQPDLPMQEITDSLERQPALDWQTALTQLLGSSPELAAAQCRVKQAKAQVQLENARRFENFRAGGGIEYQSAYDETTASLVAEIPIQIFKRNQGNILRARSELSNAHREVERIQLSLYNKLAKTFGEYQIASTQVRTFQTTILPNAKKTLELTTEGNEMGQLSHLEVLNSQQVYLRANMLYADNLEKLAVAVTQVEGMLLEGSLESVQ